MDCRTARLLLDYARPHRTELPADEAAPLEAHLASCPDCETLARCERQADDRLGKAMRDVPMPDDLRQRIFERLQTERVKRQRRWLAWGARAAAVAAIVLVGAWWWIHTQPAPKPQLDPVAMQEERRASKDREQIEAYFREEYGVTTVAPSMSMF